MKKHTDPRHIARKYVLKVLFEQLFHPDQILKKRIRLAQKHAETLKQKPNRPKFDYGLLNDLILGVNQHLEPIDKIIVECAPEWPIHQIAKVDLSILRIAIFEVLYFNRTPIKVAIDEAVELAKEYGGDNSSRFVNGVLGTVVKNYVKIENKEKS